VPLTYSLVDLESKIEWLQTHDDLAHQLAKNAKAFGRSYLRLEDHFCYIASALEFVGKLAEGTGAAQAAFDPMQLKFVLSE
jgi:hypothetical protein